MQSSLLLVAGVVVGLGLFTFAYADGAAYLSNDPAACGNCHIMEPQLEAWEKGSHARVATCNDCHAPHDNVVSKLAVKALNGFNHSWAFTTGRYPESLQATRLNLDVTEAACRYCHAELLNLTPSLDTDEISCIRCHSEVGHRDLN